MSSKPNIVWFRVDSLKPDFLSAPGSSFKATFIDELIKQGVSFTNCIVAAPYTIGSEAAMFTSFYPSINKLDGYFKQVPEAMDKNVITFVDILKSEGYFTAFYTHYKTRAFVAPYSFDVYDMADSFELDKYLSAPSPKLLMLDFEPIHDLCCSSRDGFTKKKCRQSITEVAEQIRYFYGKCCSDSDLVVLSSDHGVRVSDEPASEIHPVINEEVTGVYLTDKTIKVAFSVIQKGWLPSGLVIDRMVRNIDTAPTILDIAGVPVLRGQGISLLPYIFNSEELPELDAFSVTGSMAQSPWKPNIWCVRTARWKLVVSDSNVELYDMATDPWELENKVLEFPEMADTLSCKLGDMLFRNPMTVRDYYRDNGFDYKYYLKKRSYPLRIKLKVKWMRLVRYELTYRLRLQIMQALQLPGIHKVVQIIKRIIGIK